MIFDFGLFKKMELTWLRGKGGGARVEVFID
jgi:hypothetical protein